MLIWLSKVQLMPKIQSSLKVALDHFIEVVALDRFEAEVEEGALLTISLHVICVVALVTQFRNATTGLMSLLKVCPTNLCKLIVINFRMFQTHFVEVLIVVL